MTDGWLNALTGYLYQMGVGFGTGASAGMPEHDTPGELTRFAELARADESRGEHLGPDIAIRTPFYLILVQINDASPPPASIKPHELLDRIVDRLHKRAADAEKEGSTASGFFPVAHRRLSSRAEALWCAVQSGPEDVQPFPGGRLQGLAPGSTCHLVHHAAPAPPSGMTLPPSCPTTPPVGIAAPATGPRPARRRRDQLPREPL